MSNPEEEGVGVIKIVNVMSRASTTTTPAFTHSYSTMPMPVTQPRGQYQGHSQGQGQSQGVCEVSGRVKKVRGPYKKRKPKAKGYPWSMEEQKKRLKQNREKAKRRVDANVDTHVDMEAGGSGDFPPPPILTPAMDEPTRIQEQGQRHVPVQIQNTRRHYDLVDLADDDEGHDPRGHVHVDYEEAIQRQHRHQTSEGRQGQGQGQYARNPEENHDGSSNLSNYTTDETEEEAFFIKTEDNTPPHRHDHPGFSGNCVICQNTRGNSDAVIVTRCGHLFHEECWTNYAASCSTGNEFGVSLQRSNFPCPICTTPTQTSDLRRVFLDQNPGCCSVAEAVIAGRENDIRNLTHDLDTLQTQLAKVQGPGGSRLYAKQEFRDSVCFNCESPDHPTAECTSPPQIRTKVMMKGSPVFGKEIPSTIVVEQRSSLALDGSQGQSAGKVIGFYEDALGGRYRFDRLGVQVAFALHFFDHCCPRCGSPFHGERGGGGDRRSCLPIPGVEAWIGVIHEVNHPPSALQRMEKFKTKKRLDQ